MSNKKVNIEKESTVDTIEVVSTAKFRLPKKRINIMPKSLELSVVSPENKYNAQLGEQFKAHLDQVDRVNSALFMNGYSGCGLTLSWPIDQYKSWVNPFTEEEQEYFEKYFKHEFDFNDPNDKFLSTWELILEYNEIKVLDLSKPMEYIMYLLAKMFPLDISENLQKANVSKTTKFYFSEDKDINNLHDQYVDRSMKGIELLYAMNNNVHKLYCFLSLVDRSVYSLDNIRALQYAVMKFKDNQLERFIEILEDPLYMEKVIISLGMRSGVLAKYGSTGCQFNSEKGPLALSDNEKGVIDYLRDPQKGVTLREITQQIEQKLKIQIK